MDSAVAGGDEGVCFELEHEVMFTGGVVGVFGEAVDCEVASVSNDIAVREQEKLFRGGFVPVLLFVMILGVGGWRLEGCLKPAFAWRAFWAVFYSCCIGEVRVEAAKVCEARIS